MSRGHGHGQGSVCGKTPVVALGECLVVVLAVLRAHGDGPVTLSRS